MDIFDEIASELIDPFDDVKSTEETSIEKIKSELSSLLDKYNDKERKTENAKITSQIATLVKSEVAKIKPVQNIIEKTIEKRIQSVPVHVEPKIIKAPPQIIKEIRVEVEKKDTKRYAEEKIVQELESKIEELKSELERVKGLAMFHGGPGTPLGSNDQYAVSNLTVTRRFDATSTSLDELANVVGSLITTLKGSGQIK